MSAAVIYPLIAVAWSILSLGLGVLIGLSIRLADREEVKHEAARDSSS